MSAKADFLSKLRNKLLDTSGRNRLVNLRHSPSRTLRFLNPNLEKISSKLFSDNEVVVEIKPIQEPPKKEWVEKNGRIQRPDVEVHAKSLEIPISYSENNFEGEIFQCLYYPDELETRAKKLDRESKSALEEKGLKITYLVIGFLEYPDKINSDKLFNAPLITIPINLIKTGIDKKTGVNKYALSHN
jgi:hypothetical protein